MIRPTLIIPRRDLHRVQGNPKNPPQDNTTSPAVARPQLLRSQSRSYTNQTKKNEHITTSTRNTFIVHPSQNQRKMKAELCSNQQEKKKLLVRGFPVPTPMCNITQSPGAPRAPSTPPQVLLAQYNKPYPRRTPLSAPFCQKPSACRRLPNQPSCQP